MTAAAPAATPLNPAWQRYLDRTHAARDAYLATTAAAHREYLTGPWPDRDTYQAVERTAWMVYYYAGRAAWFSYTEDTTPPATVTYTPAADSAPYPPVSGDPAQTRDDLSPDTPAIWAYLENRHGLNCIECGIPWRSPSPGCPHEITDVHPLPAPAAVPAPTGSGS